MSLLTRDQIFAAPDRKTEVVSVPEWGGEVMVRSLGGDERDAWELGELDARNRAEKSGAAADRRGLRARLCALCICDEKLEALFSSADDVERLGAKSAAALDRVFAVAQRLNGLSKEDVRELEGNSGAGLSVASGSDSRSPSASPTSSDSSAG
jgi:hypothetical protein